MNDNTAAELSESERPTLAPMLRPVSMPPADTTDVDSRWPEEAPRHSLIAERRAPSSDESGARRIELEPTPRRPDVDVYEDARTLLVLIDVPGVAPESLSIELSNTALYVSARVAEDPRRQSPLAAGLLALSLDVPRGTDAEAVDASLRDGVLRIRIAKAADAVRRVEIAHAGS